MRSIWRRVGDTHTRARARTHMHAPFDLVARWLTECDGELRTDPLLLCCAAMPGDLEEIEGDPDLDVDDDDPDVDDV
jgi:hypothetical protein